MRTPNRFERGSGCYTCVACGKRTRNTGDEGSVRLCAKCYEEAGLENAHADGHHKDGPVDGCPACAAEGSKR